MTVATSVIAPSRFLVRRADAGDDAARRALMADVAMDAELALSVRRHPSMAAMYALHAREWDEWVVEQDGEVVGMGTVLVRDGWLDGRRVPVGYLGDRFNLTRLVVYSGFIAAVFSFGTGIAGTVAAVYGDNGVAVQKGQSLFAIVPNGSSS